MSKYIYIKPIQYSTFIFKQYINMFHYHLFWKYDRRILSDNGILIWIVYPVGETSRDITTLHIAKNLYFVFV